MITKEDVLEAQKIWGDAVVKIGKLYLEKADYKSEAIKTVKELYGFEERTVLFKPTRARLKPFRNTPAGAISYFVGDNEHFPEDQGFAIQPWTNVRFENFGIVLKENEAVAMGNYYFTDYHTGSETKVEYTLAFFRSENGNLKICLQHSSIPFPV